jgi:hypothetical protein
MTPMTPSFLSLPARSGLRRRRNGLGKILRHLEDRLGQFDAVDDHEIIALGGVLADDRLGSGGIGELLADVERDEPLGGELAGGVGGRLVEGAVVSSAGQAPIVVASAAPRTRAFQFAKAARARIASVMPSLHASMFSPLAVAVDGNTQK